MPLDVPIRPNVPHWKSAAVHIVSGVSCSMVEVFVMQPLDLIKTRMQLQSRKALIGPNTYGGVFDAFVKIINREGFLSFWRGFLPPLLSATPRRVVKFLVYHQTMSYIHSDGSRPTPLTIALAAGTGACIEGLLMNPFEVVKITQQANRKKRRPTFKLVKHIYKKHGFSRHGLLKGVSATILRNTTYHVVWIGFFYHVREATPPSDNPKIEFMRKYAIGFTSGILGSLFGSPFDVAKSKIQGPQPIKNLIKYHSTFKTISIVLKEQGFLGLYKGITPQMARSGPASGILLMTTDYMQQQLLNLIT